MKKKLTYSDFLNKCKIIHNDKYDYSKTIFNNTRDYIDIVCPIHGVFNQRLSAHLLGQGCSKCKTVTVKNALTSNKEKFLNSLALDKINNFDFSDFVYINSKTKSKVFCKKHNIYFEISPANLKRTLHSCPLCAKDSHSFLMRNDKNDFIKLSILKHGDVFDYSKVPDNFGSHDYIEIGCKICNKWFHRLAYSHANIGHSCPKCAASKIHKKLEEFLFNKNISFISNDRKLLNGKEIDIFIPSKNIGIECNGNYWHSEEIIQDKNYHLNKSKLCLDKNIFLLHFFEDELIYKFDIISSILEQKLGICDNKIYARKCSIKEVSIKDKNIFLNKNHIQGEDKSSIKLGLYYDDELVSLMTFGKPRYNNKIEWELIRFCNKKNFSIIGGASKLFKYFILNYNPQSIISYADRRISDGNLYDKLEFTFAHHSLPRYYYFPKNNPLNRLHRSNFTKNRIKKLYPTIDISKTEKEIMKELNYGRIWDCGNKVYIWKKRKTS